METIDQHSSQRLPGEMQTGAAAQGMLRYVVIGAGASVWERHSLALGQPEINQEAGQQRAQERCQSGVIDPRRREEAL